MEPTSVEKVTALRGTIGSEATIIGAEQILVSGFGLVVGLNGTGGGDIDTHASCPTGVAARNNVKPSDPSFASSSSSQPRRMTRNGLPSPM